MSFEEGDLVVISDIGADRYPDGRNNPHNSVGKITRVLFEEDFDDELPDMYEVRWPNGVYNDYYPEELLLVNLSDKTLEDYL